MRSLYKCKFTRAPQSEHPTWLPKNDQRFYAVIGECGSARCSFELIFDARFMSTRVKVAGIAIRHSRGCIVILQGPEMGWRRDVLWAHTQDTFEMGHFFFTEKDISS